MTPAARAHSAGSASREQTCWTCHGDAGQWRVVVWHSVVVGIARAATRQRGRRFGLVVAAVLAGSAACSSAPGSPASPSLETNAITQAPSNAKDAAFAKAVRTEGWAPNIPLIEDGGIATDAQGFCDDMASQPDDPGTVRNNLETTVKGSMESYGITEAPARALLIFSAQTYCPGKVAEFKHAMGN